MFYINDTNILVLSITNPKFKVHYEQTYLQNLQSDDKLIISIVTEGEIKALAIGRKWGVKKMDELDHLLASHTIYPIRTSKIVTAYAQIDNYSQSKLNHKPLPKGMSARNMGKNDLWIAATTHALNATLVTTDKDFNHLNGVYFKRDLIDIEAFR